VNSEPNGNLTGIKRIKSRLRGKRFPLTPLVTLPRKILTYTSGLGGEKKIGGEKGTFAKETEKVSSEFGLKLPVIRAWFGLPGPTPPN